MYIEDIESEEGEGMNYLLYAIITIVIFGLMIIFYKLLNKDGLYLYLGLISSILGVICIGSVDIFLFKESISIPLIVGLFICSNIIIQRYGLDEVERILYSVGFSFSLPIIIVGLVSLTGKYGYNVLSNDIYDELFGYGFNNIRCIIGNIISIIFMIWIGSGMYYSIKKSKNNLILSNLTTAFVIFFIESIVFIMITSLGNFKAVELFGMMSVRYIMEIIISVLGIIPAYFLVKFVDR